MYLLYLAKKQTCKRKKISAQNLKINHAFCNAGKLEGRATLYFRRYTRYTRYNVQYQRLMCTFICI
jgi:hypothetical protein